MLAYYLLAIYFGLVPTLMVSQKVHCYRRREILDFRHLVQMAVEIVVLSPLALRLSIRERHEVVLLVVVGLHALVGRVGVGGVVHGLARLGVLRWAIWKIEKN